MLLPVGELVRATGVPMDPPAEVPEDSGFARHVARTLPKVVVPTGARFL